ncbi:MAG TPA: polyphenol oxidase family protein [Acidothermaceae bacterium]|nr:polyphenol oxidase family protein [Acidothermaceae bacterium]
MLWLGSLGADVRFAFTSRLGGFSTPPYDSLNLSFNVGDDPVVVRRNRRDVLQRLGVSRAAWLQAQHGALVRVVEGVLVDDAPEQQTGYEADGLVTAATDIALGALSADCALVVLADPIAGVVGSLHCGRPGLMAGAVDAMVTALRTNGAQQLCAAVGPTVCGSCYEVPAEMAAGVVAVVPAAFSRARSGRAGLDVRAGVIDQLQGAGVRVVRLVGGCTREDPTTFSSRRDHVTGRMGALIWRAA